MRNLSEIRTEIDSIDEQIIELFKKRMDCAKEVGNYKKANNIPVLYQLRQKHHRKTYSNVPPHRGTGVLLPRDR